MKRAWRGSFIRQACRANDSAAGATWELGAFLVWGEVTLSALGAALVAQAYLLDCLHGLYIPVRAILQMDKYPRSGESTRLASQVGKTHRECCKAEKAVNASELFQGVFEVRL